MKTNNKHTILVVDDSKAIVSLNVGILSDEFTVATAYSGEEAIELFMKIKPTVMLLDVEMPGMDGIEVCRRIQKLDEGLYTPIIFVTSRGDSKSIAEALNAGGEGYMTKPYSAQELKARVHAAIRTKTLMNELQHANAIIEKERDSIAKIQRSLLPKDLPHLTGYNFFSDYKPSSKAGGDYYDFIQVDDQHLGVLISDVSGHGTPAAVIMAMARIALRTHLVKIRSPKAVLEKLNRILCDNLQTGAFITAFYCVIHLPTRVMTYALAGHNPALFYNPLESAVVELNVGYGFPLMIRPKNPIEEKSIQLPNKSKLVLYTDGFTEAANDASELFGAARMKDVILTSEKNADAKGLGKALIENLDRFTNGLPLKDDCTLLVIDIE